MMMITMTCGCGSPTFRCRMKVFNHIWKNVRVVIAYCLVVLFVLEILSTLRRKLPPSEEIATVGVPHEQARDEVQANCDHNAIRRSLLGSQNCREDPEKTNFEELKNLSRTIQYESFVVSTPNFASEEDKEIFLMNDKNVEILNLAKDERTLVGKIEVIENGIVHSRYDCGWKTDLNMFRKGDGQTIPSSWSNANHYDIVLPILVPQGLYFPTFMDGVMPKIAQAYDIIRKYNVKLLLLRPRDRNLEAILRRIKIPAEWVEFYTDGYVVGKYLINTCITPPLHPQLWKQMRDMLALDDNKFDITHKSGLVVLSQRVDTLLPGRRIVNFQDVSEYLIRRYGFDNFVPLLEARNISESIELFQKTKIFIGVHGGAMHNHLLARKETHIVEILPTDQRTGKPVPGGLADSIIWQMASMVGQPYWRIPVSPINRNGDVILNLSILGKVLDLIYQA